MASASTPGDDLEELEARQDPRLLRALDIVAPGTALREGIDNIVHAKTGGLLVIGDPEEVSFMFSGGIRLDVDYTPGMLYHCLLYTSPSPRDRTRSRMPSSA